MNLLAGTLYDPTTAVNKVTTAALAMTAIDTTNLRLRFTVPASGRVRVRMAAVIHGATTFPSILLGVMDGATVKGRVAPVQSLGNTAVATALVNVEADFLVTGLTPGTDTNWDAAYGVETLIAATGLKYGGPNNTTANDAFGGFAFEIWDPSPDYTPAANGVPPTTATRTALDVVDDFLDTEITAIKAKTDNLPTDPADASDVAAALATIQADTDNIQTRLPAALVGGRMDASVGAMAADVVTAAAVANGAIDAATFAAGAIDNAAIATDAIGAAELAAGAANKIRDTILSDATAFAGASVALIKAKTDNLPSDPADESLIIAATDAVMTRLGAPAGASVSADVAAVKADAATVLAGVVGVQADTDNLQTRIPAALVGGRIAAIAEVVSDKVGFALTAAYDPAKSAAQAGDAMALTGAERAATADRLLGRSRGGGADGGRTVSSCLALGRNKWSISGATLTVYDDDDVTPLYTAAIATAPGEPVTSVDPV